MSGLSPDIFMSAACQENVCRRQDIVQVVLQSSRVLETNLTCNYSGRNLSVYITKQADGDDFFADSM